MDNQKYLIIITLVDGQNFGVPDGTPDKVEAFVFAEARFGNESVLRSDPIKLVNSNPEFVTELAWQLDKRSLHQLRVERKAIKLQVFLQTREKKKSSRKNGQPSQNNGTTEDSFEAHEVELIGYTILDLRSAQQKEHPKLRWLPLLNPRFKKSSYNRPEIQLALTLDRVEDQSIRDDDQTTSIHPSHSLSNGEKKDLQNPEVCDENSDSRLYTTCLDTTHKSTLGGDDTIDNDIIIRSKEGRFYIYDAKHPHKSTIDNCDEDYRLSVTIPFTSHLNILTKTNKAECYFTANLLGAMFKTNTFDKLTSIAPKKVDVLICTTHTGALATYFELNPNLDIKLHSITGECIGIASVQVNELCSLDKQCRSIEGVFALQPFSVEDHNPTSDVQASIGVSVLLEKYDKSTMNEEKLIVGDDHIQLAKQHFGEDIGEILCDNSHDTHQLTLADMEISNIVNHSEDDDSFRRNEEFVIKDSQGPCEDDHHFCFTIDLKKFTYDSEQRLIPSLRELVIRYSYPFFGYQDSITTDASIPINANKSIVVSGFCQFNFATSTTPLLTALRELPLHLEILAFDESRLKKFENDSSGRVVAYCDINLAIELGLNERSVNSIRNEALSKTASVPIYALSGEEVGLLQVDLSIRDLGEPSQIFKATTDSIAERSEAVHPSFFTSSLVDNQPLDQFITEAKHDLETWKEEYGNKLADDLHRLDVERFKKLYQRLEAREARRDSELKKKIDELTNLEVRFKKSLSCVENLEKLLAESIEQLKAKNAIIDTRLDLMDSKISQLNCPKSMNSTEQKQSKLAVSHQQRSLDDNLLNHRQSGAVPTINSLDSGSPIRSRLRNPGMNMPHLMSNRSSSLVRPAQEPAPSSARAIKRTTGVVQSIPNGNVTRFSRPGSLRLTKETQEKLANLRKEKAELLKRGCKPSDELIQEINSLIEKLVY